MWRCTGKPGGRHGGGAFSGKDPTKVDRSGAYAARYVAKNVVAAGLADRCELQLAYVIGMATPISIAIETYGTGTVDDNVIERLIRQHFDLRPGAIIRDLDLRRPIYQQVAAYGHFGRSAVEAPWENLDRVDDRRRNDDFDQLADRAQCQAVGRANRPHRLSGGL